jgi:CelD/BcsL family acetyltransferase involved in cellulose biosynthesis
LTIRTEVATTPSRLRELTAPWQALWARGNGDIFQHHAWVAAWADGVSDRSDVRLKIGLAWQGDALVAVLPCAVQRTRGLRVLEWAAQQVSDYCDALIDPTGAAPGALRAAWDAMQESGGFDLVGLRQVRPDARVRRLLDGAVREGGSLRLHEAQERCMRIDCAWPNGEAYFRSLNKKGRNNHTRGKRILSELGGEVCFRVVDDPSMPIRPLLEEVLALKPAWLREHHPDSPLVERDAAVVLSLLEAAWATGTMALFLLECGGRIAAASINFVYDSRMQAYLTAYDPAFDRASPGTILIVDYTRWAIDHGLRQVDFLRGEEPFKFRLANAETLLDGYLGGRTLLGRVALAARDWREWRRARMPGAPAARTEESGADVALHAPQPGVR